MTRSTVVPGCSSQLARRGLLAGAAAAVALRALARGEEPEDQRDQEFEPFDGKTRIEVGERGAAMLAAAGKLGRQFEGKHGGCARCTVAALQKALDFVPEDRGVFRAATCLDGGATGGGNHSCGGFTGSGIVIGYLCGGDAFRSAALAHKLIRKVAKQYEKAYGSVLCKDVRKKGKGKCPQIVSRAATWTAEILLRQFTDYKEK